MTGTAMPTTFLSELEERAEVRSLVDLQASRRELLARHGRLIALYGSFGHYDDHRKRMAEAMKITARLTLSQGDGKKPTESQIDAEAYGSEQYQRFLDNALEEKIEYLKVQAQLDEISESIRSREVELMTYNAEIRLGR